LQEELGSKNKQPQALQDHPTQQLTQYSSDHHEHKWRLGQQTGEHQELEQICHAVFESSNDGIFFYRIDECNGGTEFILYELNTKCCALWGYSRQQVLSGNIDLLAMNDDPSAIEAALRCKRLAAEGLPQRFDWQFIRMDGAAIYGEVSLRRLQIGNENVLLAVIRDVSEHHFLKQKLQTMQKEFGTLIERSPDGIARYDNNYRRTYANAKLIAELGGGSAAILGSTPVQCPGGEAALKYEKMLRQVFDRGQELHFELHRQKKGGSSCTHIRMMPEFSPSGQVSHVWTVGRDITEIDQYRQEIYQKTFFDNLTKLPNRALIIDRMERIMDAGLGQTQPFGLMLLDLDHFKDITDILGQDVGDRLLCLVAKRLLDCTRIYDTVARLGGDEFMILLPRIGEPNELDVLAGKMLLTIAAPFDIDGREFFISASIGGALYPADSADLNELCKCVGSALHFAKTQGRNNFKFYSRELTAHSNERLEMEGSLRLACRGHGLQLYYQPQIDLSSGCVVGAEALLRWHHPENGMMMPTQFIPLAEDMGVIVEMGEWVLATACGAIAEWNQGRAAPLKMAVNLSIRQFIRNDFVSSVRNILAATGCRPEWLKLEITESLLMDDSSEMTSILHALHAMGLSISIDDFGTGFSALSYLHQFPISQIKIDRTFVRDIPADREKSALVKAILSIAVALHLEAVAEGVETPEQAQHLIEQGCQLAQGYLFGKPVSRQDFEALFLSENGTVFFKPGSMNSSDENQRAIAKQ